MHCRSIIGFVASLLSILTANPVLAGEPALTTELVTDGLDNPLELTHAPGDASRLFVLERGGYVRIVKDGTLLPTPFLDIHTQVDTFNERGLLGIAFHPQYATNGYFYVRYNNLNTKTVVARYSVSSNPDLANSSSAQTVLTVTNTQGNHNGGSIEFGLDGYLYVTVGDNADSSDAQLLTNGEYHGKILRVDVNGDDFPGDPNRNYKIPPRNPFVGVTGEDEIWAYGLRNPFRASIDRETGDYWIGDVGEGSWEEIDFQPAGVGGRNYGWGCMEGFHCGFGTGCTCNAGNLTLPILEYDHGQGCAVTGGRVYRGCAIPELQGTYFFADFCSGNIWSLRYQNGIITDFVERHAELDPANATIDSIVAFGEDAFGELYICDLGGEVFKIVPAEPPADFNGNGVPDSCETSGPGDVNSDGSVNIDDLLAVIASWGPCGPPCLADLNLNGVVDIDDLLQVIGNWS
jgi:glucose/arabinose dehydrogenase